MYNSIYMYLSLYIYIIYMYDKNIFQVPPLSHQLFKNAEVTQGGQGHGANPLTVNGMDGWRLKLRTRLTFFKIQFESI